MEPIEPTIGAASSRRFSRRFDFEGLAQHSLVEHALCPLDARGRLNASAAFETRYFFQDANRNAKAASVRVTAPFGLSPHDEAYLYGLLALHLRARDPSPEFYATPHWCLRRLGIVGPADEQGKRYSLFRESLRRLAGVVYENDRFYDPIRGEHRQVAFGFLKYSLPLDPTSSRAWHFYWDPQFLQVAVAARGSFQFDLDLYRRLDCGGRRLFLLLHKIFWRSEQSPAFELRHIAVDVLGYSPTIPTKKLRLKLLHSADRLLNEGVLSLPAGASSLGDTIRKRSKGEFVIRFTRGPYFKTDHRRSWKSALEDSPLSEPLRAIGFDDQSIHRILRDHKAHLVQQWVDVTLAAMERKLVSKDPRAYFRYYLDKAAKREATPPDWWHELRRKERERDWARRYTAAPTKTNAVFDGADLGSSLEEFLAGEGKQSFDKLRHELFDQFTSSGRSEPEARDDALRFARQYMRNRFLAQRKQDPRGV